MRMHLTARPARLLRTLAALALVGALVACDRPAAPALAPAADPALWRIQDADSTIYLFGTVHLLRPDLDWRSEKVNAAFAQAQAVYLETPSDLGDPTAAAAIIRRLGAEPPGRVIAAAVTDPAERARLAAAAKDAGLDPKEFEQVRPWFAAVRLSVAAAVAEGQSPDAGVDRALEAEAKQAGKALRYFESFEEQLSFLAGLSPEAERTFLITTLRQMDEQKALSDQMDDAWVRGDVAAMERLLPNSIAEAGPEVFAAVLTRRNLNWVDVLEQEMKGSGVVFVAVGAAHLVGPGSVVEELEKRGYTVELR